MQRVNIICIGRVKEKYFSDAIAEYAKRLQAFCRTVYRNCTIDRRKSQLMSRPLKEKSEIIKKRHPARQILTAKRNRDIMKMCPVTGGFASCMN